MRFHSLALVFIASLGLGACAVSEDKQPEVTTVARDEVKLGSCIRICDSMLDNCYVSFLRNGLSTQWCTNDFADSCYQNCWDSYGE